MDEVVHAIFVGPSHREIIDYKSESYGARVVAKHRGRARYGIITMLSQVPEQSLLAQGARLRQAVMGFVNRAEQGVTGDERLQVVECNHILGDETKRNTDVFWVG